MIDFIRLSDTSHAYTGGGTGANGIDGNFSTAQEYSSGDTAQIYSTHTFSSPRTITQFVFRLSSYADSSGPTDNGSNTSYSVQTQDASTLAWTDVPGAAQSGPPGYNSGGGGSSSKLNWGTPATTTLNVTVTNVKAVRAYVWGRGWGNEGGSGSGSVKVWEIQAYGVAGGYALVI